MTAYQSDEIRHLRRRVAALDAQVRDLERRLDEAKRKLAERVDMHDADGKALVRATADLLHLIPIARAAVAWVHDDETCHFCDYDARIGLARHDEDCPLVALPEDVRERLFEEPPL